MKREREKNCRACGAEFRDPTNPHDRRDSDCHGCHLCYSCAWPDCPVCGDEEGVRLNAEQGKVKPAGFGAAPWGELERGADGERGRP